MKNINQILQEKLDMRIKNNSFRSLVDYSHLIDFSSNDYLGLARFNGEQSINSNVGATGSRLISGNHKGFEKLESFLEKYHGFESALVFNSGYVANLGVMSTLPQRGDTILYDELIHASIRDGMKLSNANSFSFKHNDLTNLNQKITNAAGNVFVVVESVYSMDGDSPDLEKLVELCEKTNANLIVDEAHAIGVVGEKGEGLVAHLGLQDKVFAVVVTFGKALGCHGAAVLSSKTVKDYLVNFCRQFIYTTALSEHSIEIISNQYQSLSNGLVDNDNASNLKKYFIAEMTGSFHVIYGEYGNIVSVVVPGNDQVKHVASSLEEKGFFVKPILSPTVPKGQERLRICFHRFNTQEEVKQLIKSMQDVLVK